MKFPDTIAPSYLHSVLLRQRLKDTDQSYLTGCSFNTLEGLVSCFFTGNELRDSLIASSRLRNASSVCRIYREMLKYPDFHMQLIRFHKLMLRYHLSLSELPVDTEEQKECLALLTQIHDLKFSSLSSDRFDEELKQSDCHNIKITSGWVDDLISQHRIDTMIDHGAVSVPLRQAEPQQILFRKALNARQEAEGLAQMIIENRWKAEDIMVILCDSQRDGSLVRSVLQRYNIPSALVSSSRPAQILRCFDALICFALDPDMDHLLDALKLESFNNSPSQSYIQYLELFIQDVQDFLTPQFDHVSKAMENNTLMNDIDRRNLLYLEEKAQQSHDLLLSEVQSILDAETIQDRIYQCFEMIKSNPLINDPQQRSAVQTLKKDLEDCWDLLDDRGNVEMFLFIYRNKSCSSKEEITDCVALTDLKHPLPCRKVSVIFGADQKSFPGNIAMSGIFDEDYLKNTSMPSQQLRYEHYMKQLDWVYHSGEETLICSYATGTYEGKNKDVAYEIEQFTGGHAQMWPLIQNEAISFPQHHLSQDTALKLFMPDHILRGSISSFERYFQCPYAYFLKSGLHLNKSSAPEINSALIGTIQHALLEDCVNEKQKQYAETSAEEIHERLVPYFDQILALYPDQALEIRQIQNRIELNMELIFSTLADMEKNTSFKPEHLEYPFDEDLFVHDDITLHIKGFIDRIDVCLNDLRIIDYKSSSKTLSSSKIKAGLQLQLLTYLIMASRKLGKDPLGAYYFSLKNANLTVRQYKFDGRRREITDIEPEQWDHEKQKSTRLNGWTLKESDGLDHTYSHISDLDEAKQTIRAKKEFTEYEQLIIELYELLIDHLKNGDIPLDPVQGACDFCDFKAICRLRNSPRAAVTLVGEKENVESEDDDNGNSME